MIAAVLLLILLVVTGGIRLREARQAKKLADARRRASMREVAESWHFREWEQDFRSSDSV